MLEKLIIIGNNMDITEDMVNKIEDIFYQSLCPNESLRFTFPEYDHIDGNRIYFSKSADK